MRGLNSVWHQLSEHSSLISTFLTYKLDREMSLAPAECLVTYLQTTNKLTLKSVLCTAGLALEPLHISGIPVPCFPLVDTHQGSTYANFRSHFCHRIFGFWMKVTRPVKREWTYKIGEHLRDSSFGSYRSTFPSPLCRACWSPHSLLHRKQCERIPESFEVRSWSWVLTTF